LHDFTISENKEQFNKDGVLQMESKLSIWKSTKIEPKDVVELGVSNLPSNAAPKHTHFGNICIKTSSFAAINL